MARRSNRLQTTRLNLEELSEGRVGEFKTNILDDDKIMYNLYVNQNLIKSWIVYHNKKNGLNLLYDNNTGKILRSTIWVNGEIDGEEKFFTNDFLDTLQVYHQGQLIERIEYFIKGQARSILKYSNGELVSRQNFDFNGMAIPMDID